MNMPVKNDVYFEFLDHLRESGKINMFGSHIVLEQAFPELRPHEAINIVLAWMDSFEGGEEE